MTHHPQKKKNRTQIWQYFLGVATCHPGDFSLIHQSPFWSNRIMTCHQESIKEKTGRCNPQISLEYTRASNKEKTG
jgi:hypothetical protein